MSDEPKPTPEDECEPEAPDGEAASRAGDAASPASAPPASTAEDEAVRRLLKRALPPPDDRPQEFLRGVQTRIRTRSRGKFFADGWSTSSRRVSYGAVAFAMLLLLVLAFVLMTPRSFQP